MERGMKKKGWYSDKTKNRMKEKRMNEGSKTRGQAPKRIIGDRKTENKLTRAKVRGIGT